MLIIRVSVILEYYNELKLVIISHNILSYLKGVSLLYFGVVTVTGKRGLYLEIKVVL